MTTPAPWTIEEYGDDECPALVIHRDSETRICFMATPGSHGDPEKITADAHLICAAPELLASLQEIVAEWGYPNTPKWHRARAAIAKANGTPEGVQASPVIRISANTRTPGMIEP